jgi:hypothetical protein
VPRHLPGAFPYLPGQSGYSYCASHSRFFWGVRLHLIATPAGLPITWALADPKIDERQVLIAALDHDPTLTRDRPGPASRSSPTRATSPETSTPTSPHAASHCYARPTATVHPTRPSTCSNPFAKLVESIFDTLKGQLDLDLHGGRSIDGVGTRIAQRLLAMTAAIWHNRATGQPTTRSLTAYDH